MEGTLNYRGLRCYEASAASGKGVFETLRGISELVLERLATRFVHELPHTVRFILRPTGALNRAGSNLASYLLFEHSFCRALIELGYQDTVRRDAEVREFFHFSEAPAHA
jgi:hypothetical protein